MDGIQQLQLRDQSKRKIGNGAKLTNIFSKEFTVETIDHNRKRSYIQTFKNNLSEKDMLTIGASGDFIQNVRLMRNKLHEIDAGSNII